MGAGARTPEELESLFEDAFVLRDENAVVGLFEEGALLVADGLEEARGAREIARFAAALWAESHTFIADPQRILQARDTALVVGARSVNVARRRSDGTWRFAISLLSPTSRLQRSSHE